MRKKKAFTLPELLIVIALLSLITALLATIYSMGMTQYFHQSGRIALSRLGRETMDRVSGILVNAVPEFRQHPKR